MGWAVLHRVRTLWTVLVMVSVLAGLWQAGRVVLPAAHVAWTWWAASEDPAALARLELAERVSEARIGQEIDAAVAQRDLDLAQSFLALAETERVPVAPARKAAVKALEDGQTWESTKAFARGAFIGDGEGLSGMAGAFTADVVGIGDVRDLVREGWHAARGEAVDEILVGLSAVGLAVTGATWAMAGTPAPVRAGLTLVKTARKAGRLSAPLAASVGGLLRTAVDMPGLKRALASVGKFELSEARSAALAAVRTERLAPLAAMGEDAAKLYRRAGYRAVDDVLASARSGPEIARFARLSEVYGTGTRAVMKLCGRGAILLSKSLAHIFGWLFAALGWVWSVASAAAAFGRWLARVTPPRRRRRIPVGAGGAEPALP